MNVLVLTPDAVGSTLLQRLITIFMQLNDIDRPVINLHELTNGLGCYWSPDFNQEIVSKRPVQSWSYFQSLKEVVELLDSVDHYKVSRLAHYHLVNRNDTKEEQIPFYEYLDRNFYIIACQRENIFEHALSLTLARATKKLNVYSPYEKISTFQNIYEKKITLNPSAFKQCLDAYHAYVVWSSTYFNVSQYFNYEQDLARIENFILKLPIFKHNRSLIGWYDAFGMDFNTFNRCHYLHSDLGHLYLKNTCSKDIAEINITDQEKLTLYQTHAPQDWPAVNHVEDLKLLSTAMSSSFEDLCKTINLTSLGAYTDRDTQRFLQQNKDGYLSAVAAIDKMVKLDILVSAPPIKKQTLSEKRFMIENFDQCLNVYNDWIKYHPELGSPITQRDLDRLCDAQEDFWQVRADRDLSLSDQPLLAKS